MGLRGRGIYVDFSDKSFEFSSPLDMDRNTFIKFTSETYLIYHIIVAMVNT